MRLFTFFDCYFHPSPAPTPMDFLTLGLVVIVVLYFTMTGIMAFM